MHKTLIDLLFTSGLLFVALGCRPLPPVDIGMDAVGVPQDRQAQLNLKAEVERSRNDPREDNVIWKGNSDDTSGLQGALDKYYSDKTLKKTGETEKVPAASGRF